MRKTCFLGMIVMLVTAVSTSAVAQEWSPGPWSVTVTMNNQLEAFYKEHSHTSSSATTVSGFTNPDDCMRAGKLIVESMDSSAFSLSQMQGTIICINASTMEVEEITWSE